MCIFVYIYMHVYVYIDISTYRYIYIERGSSLTYIYTLLRNFIYRLETYSVFNNRETLYIE